MERRGDISMVFRLPLEPPRPEKTANESLMSDLPSLRGPILEPASGGAAQQLVILCHGVGSDGQDLIDLARYYQKVLPDAKFISPDAPFAYDMAPSGYQWFSLQDMSPGAHLAGAQQAAPILDDFIDAQLAGNGLTESELALVGFSQGTMMALHAGLRRPRPPAAIIGFSGSLVAPELLASEASARPPVLLIHGDRDETVPFEQGARLYRDAPRRKEFLAVGGASHTESLFADKGRYIERVIRFEQRCFLGWVENDLPLSHRDQTVL